MLFVLLRGKKNKNKKNGEFSGLNTLILKPPVAWNISKPIKSWNQNKHFVLPSWKHKECLKSTRPLACQYQIALKNIFSRALSNQLQHSSSNGGFYHVPGKSIPQSVPVSYLKTTIKRLLPASTVAGGESSFPFCGKSHAFKYLSSLNPKENKIFPKFPTTHNSERKGHSQLIEMFMSIKANFWTEFEIYCFYTTSMLQHLKTIEIKPHSGTENSTCFVLFSSEKVHQNQHLQNISLLSNWLFPTGKHSFRKFPIGSQTGLCNIKIRKGAFCFYTLRT